MAAKVLMTWDILGERNNEYFEFVIGEFIPGVQRLGLQPAEAWATIYGSYPQIQVGLLASDATQARQILSSNDWGILQERLFGYVKNFSYRIVMARSGFQFYTPS
ncbi:MAG: hypothetical protein HS124_07460 [Anaerolineales bacterium]|nr:hypothetical protein [Anaerolineales bacterium]MCL4260903.1 hypothetical protein [Anaerolineales bacterium]HRQ32016.1 hypothetical protein [Anaerolineales bacterium]